MTTRRKDIATIRYVAGVHLLSIGRLMTQAKDGYLDLGRELAFFVQIGYWKFLATDVEFRALWESYWSNEWQGQLGDDDVVQDAKYRLEVEIFGRACYLYTEAGILHPTGVPWDSPADDGDADAVEVET